jgi:hypothetical protein
VVEGAIQAIEDVVLELIIINSLARGSKFRSKALHLSNVLLSCEIKLFGVGESTAEARDLGL